MEFNASITQAAAKIMEHLTDIISMGNLTLAHRDAYMNHLKTGIKPDTLAVLRTSPPQIPTMFSDSVIKRAKDKIAHYENKSSASSSYGKARYHQYERIDKRLKKSLDSKSDKLAWKNIGGKGQFKRSKGRFQTFHPDQPRASSPINDNYCVKFLQAGLLAGSKQSTPERTMNSLFQKRQTWLDLGAGLKVV